MRCRTRRRRRFRDSFGAVFRKIRAEDYKLSGEARITIEEVLSGAGPQTKPAISAGGNPQEQVHFAPERALPWSLGAIAMLVAAVAGWLMLKPCGTRVLRFPVAPPETQTLVYGGEPSISPDGHYLAFVARGGAGPTPDYLVASAR